jgi:putative PIN family toxin of toxin-antitoxin system
MNNTRVVLDSNIWISYLLNKKLHLLVEQVTKKEITLVTCQQLIDEISSVAQRTKFHKYLSPDDIQEFIAIHVKICLFVAIEVIPEMVSDKKDNFLLALYHKGKASLLVTGDKLLLEEAGTQNINVATWAKFKEYFNE